MTLNLVRRSTKGSPLSSGDYDGNLDKLEQAITASASQTLLDRLNGFRDSRRVYVSPGGSDTNNGTSLGEPLKTLAAAAAAAQPGDVVEVGPGTYIETALPIRWKRDVSLLCRGMRNAVVRPATGQEFTDIFHVDSGFWCWGFQFAGHQSDQANGIQSWAISFDALADNRDIGAIGLGAFVLKSPYIQNCTSITAEDDAGVAGSQSVGDTGGGLLVDGNRCAINSPIRSMVVDSFTQVNLGGPGCLVRNDGYAQLVSFFGTFCQYHVRTESGGQVNLSGGGTSDFGTFGLMADGYSPSPIFTAKARVNTYGAARIEKTVSINVGTAVFTSTAHGLQVKDQVTVKATSGLLPTGLNASTTYYVIASGLSANNFKLSATEGGAAITLSGDATGTYQFLRQGLLSVDVVDLSANRLSRQIKYPTAGSLGSAGNPVVISSVSGNSFTVTLGTIAGIKHTYTGGGTVKCDCTSDVYPVTSATYNNVTGVTTITATGFVPSVGQDITLTGLSFICDSASRPNAGQLMFPQLVFPRNASTGAAEAKTFTYTRTGTYTLTFQEAASASGPEHEYVSGGTATVGGTDLGVSKAVYNKTTGLVTLTTKLPVPAASGSVIVNGLAFICPTSAYVVQSSVPINSSGNSPATPADRVGYRVNFYSAANGGLLNPLTQNQVLDFRNVSQISAPGHTFEYVGSGTNYDALPFNGGVPIPGNKIVETNNGKVYSSSTDELGNFNVGKQFSINGTTGEVTINTSSFNLSGLNAIGPFSRNGGLSSVGEVLREVSNDINLIASTGAPDANTVPTQFAVTQYVNGRFVTNVSASAGQPLTVTGTPIADGQGNITFVKNIQLSLNAANGLAQLDGSALLPRTLLPAATTTQQGALSAADKVKIDNLQSAANQPTSAFATAAQGTKADSAVQPADLTSALTAKADLVSGKVPVSQIPAIAISDYLGAVANQAAMLALSGQRGDWCLRTDRSRAWILSGDDASVLANWVEVSTPPDAVTSVNGQTGAVTLNLGTAAPLNVGTAAGNVVQLDGSGKLPAVDGSALTGLPPGITDLGYTPSTRLLTSSTGADVTLPLVSSTDAGLAPASGGGTANYLRADGTWATPPGAAGSVTSVGLSAPTGFSVTGSPVTSSGTLSLSFAAGYSLPTSTSQSNWDTAFTERRQWDGSSTNLNATTARTSLGLGGAAVLNVGTGAGTVAAGDDARFVTDLDYVASTRLLTSSTGADVTLPLFATNSTNAGLVPGSSTGDTTNFLRADGTWAAPPGGSPGGGSGTVTSVGLTAPTGFSVTGSPVTSSGTLSLAFASGYSLPTTTSQSNWDTAFTERRQWDGSSTNLNAATARTSLGLGGAAVLNVGTGAGTVAAGDDARLTTAVASNVSGIAGAVAITNIVSLTQAQYNAIASPSATTLYVIVN